MRIVSWNIRAGGGRRVANIAKQLARWQPDIVALSEFRATPPSQSLAEALLEYGLEHQLTTSQDEQPATNALLLASRDPLEQIWLPTVPQEVHRWLLATIKATQPFSIGVMHIPNRVSGRKYLFHEAVLTIARQWSLGPGCLIGDTNSGMPGIDEETAVFGPQEAGWLQSLEAAGWPDIFRYLKGQQRAFTWYSPNGRNGFRLDQAFINRQLMPRVRNMRYEWGSPEMSNDRRDTLSDHAAIILDFEM